MTTQEYREQKTKRNKKQIIIMNNNLLTDNQWHHYVLLLFFRITQEAPEVLIQLLLNRSFLFSLRLPGVPSCCHCCGVVQNDVIICICFPHYSINFNLSSLLPICG